MELSQIDLLSLSRLMNTASTLLSAKTGTSLIEMKNFIDRFCIFVRSCQSSIGNKVFAFEFVKDELASDLIVQNIVQCLEIGKECGKIDLNLKFDLHEELDIAELPNVCTYSEEHLAIFFRVEGSLITLIVNGVVKSYIDVLNPNCPEPRLTKYSRSCRAYKLLIEDHHKYGLPNEMSLYWADRDKRILIANRKTEKVFQESLMRWLTNNVNDGRVVGEVQKLSPEKTDIEIQGLRGNTYIIEVKWLGTNSKTDFNETRIKAGVEQVKKYLERDKIVTKAILVCYDGRVLKEHLSNSAINKTDIDPRGDYFILFLPSEAASD